MNSHMSFQQVAGNEIFSNLAADSFPCVEVKRPQLVV